MVRLETCLAITGQQGIACGYRISSVIPHKKTSTLLDTEYEGDVWGLLPGDTCPMCAPHRSQNLCRVSVKVLSFVPSRARLKELFFPNQEVSNIAELHKKA